MWTGRGGGGVSVRFADGHVTGVAPPNVRNDKDAERRHVSLSLNCGAITSAPSAPTAILAACVGHIDTRKHAEYLACSGPPHRRNFARPVAGQRHGSRS